MRIIAGTARNLELEVPEGMEVRPTSGRARKALFDSLGGIWTGATVLDLCSGSGAMALEAASRGAAKCVMVELNSAHAEVIRRNADRVARTGAAAEIEIFNADATRTGIYSSAFGGRGPDIIMADPPYASSAEIFRTLMNDKGFTDWCGGTLLCWEIPDDPGSAGEFLAAGNIRNRKLKNLGGTLFLLGNTEGPGK